MIDLSRNGQSWYNVRVVKPIPHGLPVVGGLGGKVVVVWNHGGIESVLSTIRGGDI